MDKTYLWQVFITLEAKRNAHAVVINLIIAKLAARIKPLMPLGHEAHSDRQH
jgi:hypothetical protein